MQKWEYINAWGGIEKGERTSFIDVEDNHYENRTELLKKLGLDGWELVSVVSHIRNIFLAEGGVDFTEVFYFKRPIEDE